MTDLTLTGQLLLVMLTIAAHVVLLIGSYKWNSLFLITCAFCILAPLSVAAELPTMAFAKWGRVYLSLLTVVVGALFVRAFHFRGASLAFLIFITYYVAAGAWSDVPLEALKYKGLCGLAALAGLMLAASIKDSGDVRGGLRILLPAAIAFALLIMSDLIRNPGAISHIGRLASFGMNPNRIGQTSAPLLILSSFIALHDPIKKLRIVAFATCAILAIIILYSGSRGALGEALIGVFIVAFPLIRRPVLLFFVLVVVAGTVEIASAFVQVDAHAADRLTEVNFDTREGIWGYAFGRFAESPMYGIGWVYERGTSAMTTQNMHSIYMQVLVETGLIGITFMSLMLLFLGAKALAMYRALRHAQDYRTIVFLALSLVTAILAVGFISSGTIVGTTLNAVFLAFGIGLFDRLPELAADEEADEAWYPSEDGAEHHELEPDYDDEYEQGYDDERVAPHLI